MISHWTPETALRRIEHTHVGGHHIGVRKEEVRLFSDATYGAIKQAAKVGKPLPSKPPQVIGAWPGSLWMCAEEMAKEWGTLLAYQAPRMSNQPTGVIRAFKEDEVHLSGKQKRGVLPVLFVTDISYTRRWTTGKSLKPDTDFYDPEGPDKIQALALEQGVCIVRTTQDELPDIIDEVLTGIHLGKCPHRLIIP